MRKYQLYVFSSERGPMTAESFHTLIYYCATSASTAIRLARMQPATFLGIAARLVLQDFKLTLEQSFGGLSAEDYAVLRAIREAIPEANNQSSQAVLE